MAGRLLCVAVQYNDPDGWIWALIYAYGAAVTWPAIRGRYSVWALVGAIGYFAGAIYWTPKEMVEHPDPGLAVHKGYSTMAP